MSANIPYRTILAAAGLVLVLGVRSVQAADAAASTAQAPTPPSTELSAAAMNAIPGFKPDAIVPTPVPGIVEVRRRAEIVYMTRDGQYVFTGDLVHIADSNNLSEAHRRDLRRKLLSALPESEEIVFSPPNPQYTVTVFTDVDCHFCQAFHKQIGEYNRLGIRVRYAFYPRSGPNTESWRKAEQVWCSADRRSALTRAKLGEPLEAKPCASTPVAKEYELAQDIGLEGTPMVVASNGAVLGGYVAPDTLLGELKKIGQ